MVWNGANVLSGEAAAPRMVLYARTKPYTKSRELVCLLGLLAGENSGEFSCDMSETRQSAGQRKEALLHER
jgi:hypothetical protein